MTLKRLQERQAKFPDGWQKHITNPKTKRIIELYLHPSLMSLTTIGQRVGLWRRAVANHIKKASDACNE